MGAICDMLVKKICHTFFPGSCDCSGFVKDTSRLAHDFGRFAGSVHHVHRYNAHKHDIFVNYEIFTPHQPHNRTPQPASHHSIVPKYLQTQSDVSV